MTSPEKISKITLTGNESIKEAMNVIDHGALGIAFLVDNQKHLQGVVTDGDIRRTIINGININKPIKEIINYNPIFLKNNHLNKEINRSIPIEIALRIPAINNSGQIIGIYLLYTNQNHTPILVPINNHKKLKVKKVKKILITGGAGYLGSILSRHLLKKGYQVTILDNLTYGDYGIRDINDKKLTLIKGDCRNISDLTRAMNNVDAVIHLAAIVGDPASALNPQKTIEINYLATTALAQTCKFNQINRFLFISTCSVYGAQSGKEKITETHPLNPVSLYAQTKIKSEEGIMALADENFSPTIFRFSTLFGLSPRMRFDLVINLLTAKAIIDKKIEIFGGNQYRPFLSLYDASEACLKWLESPIESTANQIINIGFDNQNLKIKEIGKIIKKIIPETKIEIQHSNMDERDYNVSFNKMKKLLNIKKPIKSMKEIILEIKKYVQKNKIKDINNPIYNNYQHFNTNGSK